LLSLITGLLFGLAPAIQMVRPDLQGSLKEGTRGGTVGGNQQRLGRVLVTAEIALAVVVVVGAALLMRSFWTLRNAEPGFRPDGILVVDLAVPTARYDPQATTVFYRQLVERMSNLPGVQTAAAASDLPPVAAVNNWDIAIEGRARAPGQAAPSPNVRVVTRNYFRALSVPAAHGRLFGPEDTEASVPVAVINETAARGIWPGADPIGHRVRFSSKEPWVTIIGVVRDVRSAGLGDPVPTELFLLHEQLPAITTQTERTMYVVLRTSGDPTALAAPSRRIVRELDPLLAIVGMRTMTEIVDRSVAQPRFTMLLLALFGGVALALAAIGIYGIISYGVRRRTREIGIRMALGASPTSVLRLVVGQGMRLAFVGLALGVIFALVATRAMARLLYGIGPTDPATFAAITVLLAVVAFVASWLPARRAVLTDPTSALRAE
jgi:predicted permease